MLKSITETPANTAIHFILIPFLPIQHLHLPCLQHHQIRHKLEHIKGHSVRLYS